MAAANSQFRKERDQTKHKILHNDIKWERATEHGITLIIMYYAEKFPDLALKETSVHITPVIECSYNSCHEAYTTALSLSCWCLEESFAKVFSPK